MPNKTLSDKNDIKILILYMINNVPAKMTEKVLTDILISSSFVDYFTFTEVIEEMLIAGLIDKVKEDGENVFKMARLGYESLTQLERRLPLFVREKSMSAAMKVLSNFRRQEEIEYSIEEIKNGCIVNCSIVDMGDKICTVSMYVPNKVSGELVVKNFDKNRTQVYKTLIDMLCKKEEDED